MDTKIIGRKEEQKILKRALESREGEMVAVIGRRRVGKTFLVKSYYKEHIIFEITGAQNAPQSEQLFIFTQKLNELAENILPVSPPKDWLHAFFMLRTVLEKKKSKKKQVIFFDEFPWLAAQKSSFLRAFGHFWNSYANWENFVVVICGSAASWMIENVVNNTGGLYNRITKRIFLEPFNLAETAVYLNKRNVHFDRYQVAQLYMALGGIPYHLNEIQSSRSAVQNINYICFSKNGLLREEFSNLYPSLFKNAERHIKIIRALAAKRIGLTRKEIVSTSKLPNGGTLTKTLKELEQSGFIKAYHPFGKRKKDTLFRLTDEYSLFYLKFVEENAYEGDDTWQLLSQTQAYKIWSGYAFENICLRHIPQIKKALGISGVYAISSSFYKKGNKQEKGVQIDLLIDRNDRVINICEIKFHKEPFSISKDYADTLREKMGVFRAVSKTKKYLMLTFISAFGLKVNQYSLGIVNQSITLQDLFEN